MKEWILPALFGFATGILSSWGVGGGTLLLLCMTLFLGVDQTSAQGINLLYFLPTAAVGLLVHRKNGYLDKAALRALIPLGTLCAAGAALLATVVDITFFRRPFGIFLLFAAFSLLLQKKDGDKKRRFVPARFFRSQRRRGVKLVFVYSASVSFSEIASG